MTAEPTTLGSFTLCLAVKDLAASRAFYEKLDFRVVSGDAAENWLVLRNGSVKIGLFQGILEGNTLTFNPGWNVEGESVERFTDVREHQRQLRAKGIAFTAEADETGSGPAYFMLADPDGNAIFFDQYVASPD